MQVLRLPSLVGQADVKTIGQEIGACLIGRPDKVSGVGGKQIADVVALARLNAEPVGSGAIRRVDLEDSRGRAVVEGARVVVDEGEDHVLPACGQGSVLITRHTEDAVGVTAVGCAEEVDVLRLQRGRIEPRLVDAAIQVLNRPISVGPDVGHVVPCLEIGDALPEVGLVFGKVAVGIDRSEVRFARAVSDLAVLQSSLLPVENHGRAVECGHLCVGIHHAVGVVVRHNLVVADQIVEQRDVIKRRAAFIVFGESIVGAGRGWRACAASSRIAEKAVSPVEDHVLVEDIKVPGRAVTHAVPLTARHLAEAIERLSHKDEVPLNGAGLVDAILPELRGEPLRKVAAQTVNSLVGLLLGRAARMAGFLKPVGRIIGEVFPQLTRGRRVSLEFVALQQKFLPIRIVGICLGRGIVNALGFDQRVVASEIKLPNIGPISEVIPIRGNGDLGAAASRLPRVALLGIPLEVGVPNFGFLGVRQPEIHRALTHHRIGRAVVESSIHHHAHTPLVELGHEGLELRKSSRLGSGPAEHGVD